MTLPKRPGRKQESLPISAIPVVSRIREIVAQVHAGNLREAALHTGLPYATLRQLYRGDTAEPSMSTLSRLADAYGLSVDWFLGRSSAAAPAMGWEGILPADPETGSDRYSRRVWIPFAAWPLPGIAIRLQKRLRGPVPPAADEFELRRTVTAFLLQPLLAARAAGAPVPLACDPPLPGEPPLTPERRERWLMLLRRLGEFWEAALQEVSGKQ
jgi:transcriptional regulator with XRE-family HTH domain